MIRQKKQKNNFMVISKIFFLFLVNIFLINSCTKKPKYFTLIYEYEIFNVYNMQLFSVLNTINIKDKNVGFRAESKQYAVENDVGNVIFSSKKKDNLVIYNEQNETKYFIDNVNKTYFQNNVSENDDIVSKYNCGQLEVFFLSMINHEEIEDNMKIYLEKFQKTFNEVPIKVEFKKIDSFEKILNFTCTKYEIFIDNLKRMEIWLISLDNLGIADGINFLIERLFSLSGNRLFELFDNYRKASISIIPKGLIVRMILLNEDGIIQEKINLLDFNRLEIPDNFFKLEKGLREVSQPTLRKLETQKTIARMTSREKKEMKVRHKALERKSSFMDNIIRNETIPSPYYKDHQ